MYPHQLLGFFSLELRISATQGCISGGGRAVKWPAMTKPPEIPKQKTFSSLHKSTHVTPPSFTQTATALRVGELGSFCWEKPKQSKTKPQENSSAKVFGSRDWESGKWAQPEAREHSPAQWPSLKIPSIMKLSSAISAHHTPALSAGKYSLCPNQSNSSSRQGTVHTPLFNAPQFIYLQLHSLGRKWAWSFNSTSGCILSWAQLKMLQHRVEQ